MSDPETPSESRQGELHRHGAKWELHLYVASDTITSLRAIATLERICRTYLAENYRIEVIDLAAMPDVAEELQITETPTLIKMSPRPVARVQGDLSDATVLLRGLGIPST
jgi:circadian clock protein KaiB